MNNVYIASFVVVVISLLATASILLPIYFMISRDVRWAPQLVFLYVVIWLYGLVVITLSIG